MWRAAQGRGLAIAATPARVSGGALPRTPVISPLSRIALSSCSWSAALPGGRREPGAAASGPVSLGAYWALLSFDQADGPSSPGAPLTCRYSWVIVSETWGLGLRSGAQEYGARSTSFAWSSSARSSCSKCSTSTALTSRPDRRRPPSGLPSPRTTRSSARCSRRRQTCTSLSWRYRSRTAALGRSIPLRSGRRRSSRLARAGASWRAPRWATSLPPPDRSPRRSAAPIVGRNL